VATDALQPPTLAIISPTPRAFTFPITHNLTDSPFSSPSNSPFEPDHRAYTLSSCTTPPISIRTLTPDTTISSVSSASPSHKRRKSSTGSDIERRPKKGDEDYINRPENAFILFRRKCCEDRQQEDGIADGPTKKQRQADLSKTISQQWKSLSTEERQHWEQLAKEKKKEHEQMYPNYVYRPQRAKDKDGRSKSRKPKGRLDEADGEGVSFVLPMSQPPRHHHHGRSASAPTPPPYQAIQIPNVYQMTPSCPTSPSLLPMIARRSSHPGHEDTMANFDYVAPSQQFGNFEASLQPSEFVRSMFNLPSLPLDQPHEQMPLLPPHQLISPSSSGPSSPASGPFTPTSALLSHFSQLSAHDSSQHPGCGPEPQSQAERDLQMEMQLQQEYASYSWETNMWPGNTDLLLGNDFDLGAIPPIELGLPKLGENMMMCESSGTLEFGHEFSQALEGHHYVEDGQNLDGLLGFDDMMAGHGF